MLYEVITGCMIPNLTIAENLFLGHEDVFSRGGLLSGKKMNQAAREVLASYNFV